MSKDKGFVVGVVSSHGHESGHIQVWDVLPEVDAIHVCTIADDADLDAAVVGAMASKYRNTGQTCVCANRLYIQDTIYDDFTGRLAQAVSGLVVGDGLKGETHQGPLIDMAAVEKVEDHVKDAVDKGARVVAGGQRHELGGTFYEPTILADVTQDMKVAREETFGPVAPLFRFKDDEEVIRLANDTEFGLGAGVFTRDVARAHRVAAAIRSGIVWVNTYRAISPIAPFGGFGQSGYGRESGIDAIYEYTRTKSVWINTSTQPMANPFVMR